MCTPWTITKLVKKDFMAYRFSVDDEEVDERGRYATIRPQLPKRFPMRNMAFDDQRDYGWNGSVRNKNMSSPSCHKISRQQNYDPKQVKETTSCSSSTSVGSSPCGRGRYQSCSDEESTCSRQQQRFGDEDKDYIVFCFKEDGTFDVVKSVKSEGNNFRDSTSSKNSRQINRKNEGEKGKNICPDRTATAAYSRAEVTLDSSDSTHSDHSTGSFAFPVLNVEWSGSPVHMPKLEGLDLRKHKARCIGFQFQCCRF